MPISVTGISQELVPPHSGAASDTVAPARLELSLTFRAVSKRLARTAVGAEFHTPPRGELPVTRPANCGRQGCSPRLARSLVRRWRIGCGGGLPRDGGRETLV